MGVYFFVLVREGAEEKKRSGLFLIISVKYLEKILKYDRI